MTINYRAWTNKQITTLRELADSKLSATAIGEQIGVTKNAVIGQSRRSGIQLKFRPNRQLNWCERKVYPTFKAPTLVPPDPSQAVPLLDLKKHHCRQVVSTRDDLAMFCAASKHKHYSYCAFHAARNFRPTES